MTHPYFKKIFKFVMLTSACVTMIPSPVYCADSPLMLSLDTAILFALNNNPELHIVHEQTEQAQYSVDEARALYYPQVDFSVFAGYEYSDPASFPADQPHTGTGHGNASSEYSLSMNQMVFDGLYAKSEVGKRQQLHTSAEFQMAVIRQKVIMDTVQAYLDVYKYQQTLKQVDMLIERLDKTTTKVNLMVEAGAENKVKAKYAESRLSYAQSEQTNAQSELADAMASLEFLTGKLPAFEAASPEFFDVLAQDISKYFTLAFEKNKNLLLNESDKKAAEYEVDKTKSLYYPSVNLVMEYDETKDVGGEIGSEKTASAMMQMNYKIFDGFSRNATSKRVDSELREAEYKIDSIKRNIRQKVKASYNQILSLEQELAIVDTEIITNTELQDLYHEQFELGEGDIMNLIEGDERLYQSQVRRHGIEIDIIYNSLELMQHIGFLDKDLFCTNC